jgi:UDP-N-acetylglucosamine 2-epimerase (non-hydrolysing)
MVVLGTRPELFKLAPVVRALVYRGHPVRLVATGQHPMVTEELLQREGLRAHADLSVHRPGHTPSEVIAAILERLPPLLVAERPALAVVQGDTASTFGAALAAFHGGIPVAHVEAGLRTGDLAEPFPEEGYRAMVARIAQLHFAPTSEAAARLAEEGIDRATIHITGNTGIDALETVRRQLAQPEIARAMEHRFGFAATGDRPLVVATVHRRENHGPRLLRIAAGLRRIAEMAIVALPLHPNPAVADLLTARLGRLPNIVLLPPVEHAALVWLMMHARLIVTDSGGIQEEAPTLGVRALVLRQATERGEAVATGMARLVPLSADAIASAAAEELARAPARPVQLYGDGRAAMRIALEVERFLGVPVSRSRLSRLPAERRAPPRALQSLENSW